MCGVLATFTKDRYTDEQKAYFNGMLDKLKSRGPDETSVFYEGPVALGHTRLSIIDLKTGSQPIFNEDKSVACILNGEIYNFQEIRDDLIKKGHTFQTKTDTEVIVHLYEEKGESVFENLEGMFAIVLYDRKRECLLVARDRMGEKPIYYTWSEGKFMCSSELKSLVAHPDVKREIDPNALAGYFSSLYVPAPLSIFKSIKKLRPGRFLRVSSSGIEEKIYWAPKIKIRKEESEEEVLSGIRAHLRQALKNKLESDVPLGVFLSGGIDSSAVVAFMSEISPKPIKTFSVGFGENINELPFAKEVAQRFGTDHTEIQVETNLEKDLLEAVRYYDEPFADTSNIPTYLISREARKHVKVILTGDGGDELFAGYDQYVEQKYYSGSRFVSKGLKLIDMISKKIGRGPMMERFYPYISGNGSRRFWKDGRTFFNDDEIREFYRPDFKASDDLFGRTLGMELLSDDPLAEAYDYDLNYYLPDDLLKKVDMASMAHGLECRAPFLDHHMVEYAMGISPALKVKGNQPKYLLRTALKGTLPETIVNREKQGFGMPIDNWVQDELKPMIHDYLWGSPLIGEFVDRKAIHKIFNAAQIKNNKDWRAGLKLWILFVLELWMRNYKRS